MKSTMELIGVRNGSCATGGDGLKTNVSLIFTHPEKALVWKMNLMDRTSASGRAESKWQFGSPMELSVDLVEHTAISMQWSPGATRGFDVIVQFQFVRRKYLMVIKDLELALQLGNGAEVNEQGV